MENNINNTNSIFRFIFIGALLFVAGLAFTMSYLSNIVLLELNYMVIAFVLFISSMYLLYKAAKEDKERLGRI